MSNFIAPRPTDPNPVQAREPVPGTCPECGAESLARYPVLSEGGWFLATKCQACLHTVARERWNRLGYVTLTTDALG